MTVETATPKALFPISGIGPYGVTFPYGAGEIVAAVVKDGLRVVLPTADYSMTPASSATTGSAFLSTGAVAAYAGGTLVLQRKTVEEQGYVGAFPGEQAIAAQLDRLTRRVQELTADLTGALRIDAAVTTGTAKEGKALLFTGGTIAPGPDAADIAGAQGYATDALASKNAAAGSATAAAASATAADASAVAAEGAVSAAGLPVSLAGKALNFLRVVAGATGYEHRTPAQVLTDLSISGHDTVATTIADLNAQQRGGVFYAANGATGNPLTEAVAVEHIPANATTTAVQIVVGLTSGRQLQRVEAASTWGAWQEVLAIPFAGQAQGDILYRGATGLARLSAGVVGQVLVTGGAGANPAWGRPTELLGTLTTTSLSVQTLSGLNLAPYRFIEIWWNGVSASAASTFSVANLAAQSSTAAASAYNGMHRIELATGLLKGGISANSAGVAIVAQEVTGLTNITTASTSISVSTSAGTWDAGSVNIYGVR